MSHLPTSCLSVFHHFVGLALKGLTNENASFTSFHFKVSKDQSFKKKNKKKTLKLTQIHKISKAISSIRGLFVSLETQYNNSLNTYVLKWYLQ